MLFAFLPTLLLALSTGAHAQLSSSGFATPSPQTSSASPTFITPSSSVVTFITTSSRAASVTTTSSAASSSIPIFSCVVFVGSTTSSVATPSPTTFSSFASSFVETFSSFTSTTETFSEVTQTPETFSSSTSTDDHGFHSSKLLIASFPSSSASNDDFSSFSSARRPLTTTISASVGTFSGTATTIYATGSVSIANPSSLPTCSGLSSGPITGSSASSAPAGSQTALDSSGDKKPSAGVVVGHNSAGIAFGALAGIGLALF